jgi:hypothetical protein
VEDEGLLCQISTNPAHFRSFGANFTVLKPGDVATVEFRQSSGFAPADAFFRTRVRSAAAPIALPARIESMPYTHKV